MLRHRNALLAYLLACVRDHNDAEDLLQEVAVTVVSSFEKLRDEAEFMPWAREIARRHVLSFFRRSSRPLVYNSELVGILADAAARVQEREADNRRCEALRECLQRLPQRSRTILAMRYDGSASGVDEIANALGRSMAATYGLLKRIRQMLRTCVEEKVAAEELA